MEGVLDSDVKLARKESEVVAADLIIVASRFTAGTLRESPAKLTPVAIVPYGAPEVPVAIPARPPPPAGGLRAIFVGALTQRKGLSYALEAVRRLGPRVSLTLIGARPAGACRPLMKRCASIDGSRTCLRRRFSQKCADMTS